MYDNDIINKTVAVIGCGFVGNSLIDTFSKKFNVLGYDINSDLIERREQEYASRRNVKFLHQHEYNELIYADMYNIAVPTLIDNRTGQININPLLSVKKMLEELLVNTTGKIVVVECSCYVGMTRKIFSEFETKYGAHVIHSAERYDEGRTVPLFHDIPKLIGGLTKKDTQKALEFYTKVFSRMVPVSNPETSEMCKLTENCQRIINIAYINQITDNCRKFNVDPTELLQACGTKPFGFFKGDDNENLSPLEPNEVGIIDINDPTKKFVKLHSSLSSMAGSCLSVNADWYLYNCHIPLLSEAVSLERDRPKYKAHELLKMETNIKNVLVVGIGFKRNSGTVLFSSPITFANELEDNGVNVDYLDDLVTEQEERRAKLKRVYKTADFLGTSFNNLLKYDLFCFTQQHECLKPFINAVKNHFGEDKVHYF